MTWQKWPALLCGHRAVSDVIFEAAARWSSAPDAAPDAVELNLDMIRSCCQSWELAQLDPHILIELVENCDPSDFTLVTSRACYPRRFLMVVSSQHHDRLLHSVPSLCVTLLDSPPRRISASTRTRHGSLRGRDWIARARSIAVTRACARSHRRRRSHVGRAEAWRQTVKTDTSLCSLAE